MQHLKQNPAPAATGQRGSGKELGGLNAHYITGAAPAHRLLNRLDRVEHSGQGRWLARCPAHDDRTPSLTVRETDDGTVLLHCFAGCGADAVMAAVGLRLGDLFPDRGPDEGRRRLRRGERWVPRDVLAAVAREAVVVIVAAETIRAGEKLTDADMRRVYDAGCKLRAAALEVGCVV